MVKELLTTYKLVLGQEVSFQKSFIMFSENVSLEMKHLLYKELDVMEDGRDNKYMGMPIMVGRNKKAVFDFVKENLKKRIHNW